MEESPAGRLKEPGREKSVLPHGGPRGESRGDWYTQVQAVRSMNPPTCPRSSRCQTALNLGALEGGKLEDPKIRVILGTLCQKANLFLLKGSGAREQVRAKTAEGGRRQLPRAAPALGTFLKGEKQPVKVANGWGFHRITRAQECKMNGR